MVVYCLKKKLSWGQNTNNKRLWGYFLKIQKKKRKEMKQYIEEEKQGKAKLEKSKIRVC